MSLRTIALALVMMAGAAPTMGAALAQDHSPAQPADPETDFQELTSTRAFLEQAVGELSDSPDVVDGFQLAQRSLEVQQDRLGDSSPQGTADQLEESRQAIGTVEATVNTARTSLAVHVANDIAPPSQAILELADQVGVVLTEDQRADVERLDELDAPWPGQLSELVRAFQAFHAETDAALADVSAAELRDPAQWIQQAEARLAGTNPSEIDLAELEPPAADSLTDEELSSILEARDQLLQEALETRSLAETTQAGGEPDVQACPVIAVGLANEATTYEQDCRLILDLGGGDTYANNAGGAWQEQAAPDSCLLLEDGYRAAALVDLGGRNDVYGNTSAPRACGVNGGATLGSGFLFDDGGADRYIAGSLHSYAQGASNTGTGTLLDLGSGDDVYQGDQYTNAQAFVGSSMLYDAGGQDRYLSSTSHAHGYGAGGQAALVDAGGNDVYRAPSQANGGGALPGSTLLLDTDGDDLYESGGEGSNGGGFLGGQGLLVDLAGSDSYLDGGDGANGGGSTGVGSLVDVSGHDTYRAEDRGSNGGGNFGGQGLLFDATGDDEYVAGSTGANGGASLASGLLLDGEGADTYEDRAGGTGENKTVAPKGLAGAQIDAPHAPSEPDDPPPPPPSDAPNARPHVVVGDPDSGINPYHEIYQRPDLTEHPCTYIPDYPCDVPALNLTLDADNLKSAIKQDLEIWQSVEPGQWYWIPGTSIVAVSCSDDGPPCILSCSIEDLAVDDELNCNSGSHGTHTSSTVLMENPDALIAFRETAGRIAAFEDRGIPVDLYTVSYGPGLPAPIPSHAACPGQQEAPLYVTSAGNTPYSTFNSCRKGDPGKIPVGGAYAQDRTEEGDATKNPEVVSYYCRPTADDDTIDQIEPACGTSFSAPTVAGALSKTLLDVRQHTGYTGNLQGQVLDPEYGENGLTVGDLREAMNRTATYDPEPRYDNTDTTGSVPLNPIAPWLQWGWGFYDAANAEEASAHLLEDPADPRPLPVRAYMEAQHTAKTGLYGDRS